MEIRKRSDHTAKNFLKRTISAQLHALGLLLAIAGLVVLMPFAAAAGPTHLAAALIFGVTGILVFLTSSAYHFLNDGFELSPRWIDIFESLDHFAIYLFIAGTHTPFLLNAVAAPRRGYLIAFIWTAAIVGILYTGWKHRLPQWAQRRAIYTSIFVLMGWTTVVAAKEIYGTVSTLSLVLMIAGGLAYSVGAIVYATKRPKLFEGVFGFHELWHIFVMAGFALHYFMILGFYRR